MLVLTRKVGEEIRIDNDIVVRVTSVQGGRVKLGIDAPRHRKITRPEAAPVAGSDESVAQQPTRKADQSRTNGVGGVSYASAVR